MSIMNTQQIMDILPVSYTHLDVYKRQIKTGVNKIPEAEKSLLRFKDIILKYNEKALEKEKHPRDVYKEPCLLYTSVIQHRYRRCKAQSHSSRGG